MPKIYKNLQKIRRIEAQIELLEENAKRTGKSKCISAIERRKEAIEFLKNYGGFMTWEDIHERFGFKYNSYNYNQQGSSLSPRGRKKTF
ncbi:MAG: hypothetical protein KKC75_00495 [Nanoarchaeota archaeon]|nr:hypothetical protein [Nanoarchaeota archaeon]MBU1005197.1 hypothetical protein [Nanoarchaeota archaeon]MBU1946868.1 hypothetical protein [Nanoarchaeota archaeon]